VIDFVCSAFTVFQLSFSSSYFSRNMLISRLRDPAALSLARLKRNKFIHPCQLFAVRYASLVLLGEAGPVSGNCRSCLPPDESDGVVKKDRGLTWSCTVLLASHRSLAFVVCSFVLLQCFSCPSAPVSYPCILSLLKHISALWSKLLFATFSSLMIY